MITLNFDMETKNIIRDNDYKDLEYSEFIKHVNQESVRKFIRNTLRLPLNIAYELKKAIMAAFSDKPILGVRHCDTYLRDNSWRVQLHINFRIFPESLYLIEMKKKDSPYLVGYAGKDLLMLTFSIDYI